MKKQIILNIVLVLIVFVSLFYFLKYQNINIAIQSNDSDILFIDGKTQSTNNYQDYLGNNSQNNNIEDTSEIIDGAKLEDPTTKVQENNQDSTQNASEKNKFKNTEKLSNDEVLLKEAFSLKYNKPLDSIQLEIQDFQGKYFKGIVDFDYSGMVANFFAYKNNSSFTIVGVENGVISCNTISEYNFPSSIIPNCYNPNSGQVINR